MSIVNYQLPKAPFIGKEKDNESYLDDFGVRKYDDGIGRFTSIDPLWELDYSWSPYHYCRNNPLVCIDPNGLDGYLTIHSSVTDEGSSGFMAGHSWVSYTPINGNSIGDYTTYGTWGYEDSYRNLKIGLNINKEKKYVSNISRITYISDEQELQLFEKIDEYTELGEDGWTKTYNCAGFASETWNYVTGENLDPYVWHGVFTNPKALGESIIEANGGENSTTVKEKEDTQNNNDNQNNPNNYPGVGLPPL